MKYKIVTQSEDETISLGHHIGSRLKGSEILLLESDLGGGKTTFTKGLVAGIGTAESVSSPTFTISQEYTGGRFRVYHFDLYRLGELGIMSEELQEIIDQKDGIVVIEWPGLTKKILPKERTIHIEFNRQKYGENVRSIIVTYPDTLDYLLHINMLKAEKC